MFGVDKIGEIRRAYFEQGLSIKEIVRALSVSRATVRKVIRGLRTEFKYARDIQPSPKLGVWVDALTEILEAESKLAKRERRSTQRLFEELRGRGYDGAHDSVHRFAKFWREERARVPTPCPLCADELRARGSLPVRLEPRDDHVPRTPVDGQGGAHEAVAQPYAVRQSIFSRDPGAGVRRP